ncbi:MAG: uracil phosphoribosyltransferase [Holosporaceae bacterium]|jgi:uracil phosphoribosyltransferase|nr:uracil phosphoribosyltransferase [Holosporaceae bacterium]
MKKYLYISLFVCSVCILIFIDNNYKLEKSERAAETETKPAASNLIVVDHPLIQHHLSIIRNKNTKSNEFRESSQKIAGMLILEATKNLPMDEIDVSTPIEKTKCRRVDPNNPVVVISILRAGLAISTVAERIIPGAVTLHLGMYRDEKTHKPVWYYNRLPKTFANQFTKVYVCDPMLATGGSAYEAIKECITRGANEENIVFVCVISAPEGVAKLLKAFPKIKIITASVDSKLNDKAYIIPGLGDAGDRTFNTTNIE